MKNSERKEFKLLASTAIKYFEDECKKDIVKFVNGWNFAGNTICGVEIPENDDWIKWMDEEYIPSHKFNAWEMEAMAHTSKMYNYISKNNGRCFMQSKIDEKKFLSNINYPSIVEGETVNIDEELRKHGMIRW